MASQGRGRKRLLVSGWVVLFMIMIVGLRQFLVSREGTRQAMIEETRGT